MNTETNSTDKNIKNDPILQGYKLKHLSLKNRIFSACHEPNISEGGFPKERYRLYHEEKCKGGVGLCMFGGSATVSRDSEQAFGNLNLGSDEIIPYFKQLATITHKYDVPLICQVTHMGRRNDGNKGSWLPVVSASSTREPAHRAFPKALEVHEIKRIINDYVSAALRCQAGDLDGIELEAYGHLMDSFWSPLTNFRDDEYGGSLDNRMRFSLEVIDAIRQAVGEHFVMGIRLVIDELDEHGLQLNEGLQIAKILDQTGQIDFFNIIVGSIESDDSLTDVIPNMGTPVAPHIEKVKQAKAQLNATVMHSARINDIATARHCIRGDYMDLVGMTRSHFADPHIIKKVMAGEEDRIRPCVGASYCLDRIYKGGAAYCIHNPATMRESTMPHIIVKNTQPGQKTVVVVGAGPAGLEAARVSALRGHKVVVLEASEHIGGQIRLSAKLPRRSEMIGIVDWLFSECEIAGVSFHYNVYAEASDVLAFNPDIVIDATGGIPNTDFVTGGDSAETVWDVLSGNSTLKDGAVIYDDNGGHQALSCVEYMIGQGVKNLSLISPDRMLGHDLGGNNYPPYYKVFYENNVNIILNTNLKKITKQGSSYDLSLYNYYTKSPSVMQVSQLIIEHGTVPVTDLYDELSLLSSNGGEYDIEALVASKPQTINNNADGKFQLFRVGDAQSSRNIHAAIYDSLRLCMTF